MSVSRGKRKTSQGQMIICDELINMFYYDKYYENNKIKHIISLLNL